MSLEGRMMMPAPVSTKKDEKVFASAPSVSEQVSRAPNDAFTEHQANKLLEGLTNPEELAIKFGPTVMDQIMKRAQSIGEYKTYGLADTFTPPEVLVVKTPHSLSYMIPRVLEHYTSSSRNEDDEQEYIDLLSDLKKDKQFTDLLSQYKKLIELYPDRTEEYEMKAMKDFVELNARLNA